MKCQKCTKAATLHITEVVSDDQSEELHLCEECANKYLYEPQKALIGVQTAPAGGRWRFDFCVRARHARADRTSGNS